MCVKLTTDQFIKRAVKIYGNRYIYNKSIYTHSQISITVTCRIHGDFFIMPSNFLSGKGCYECGKTKSKRSRRRASKNKRPDMSNIIVPNGSKAVAVGRNGDYTLVDKEDYQRVNKYNWVFNGGYAYNYIIGFMQRFIMNTPDGMETDHIDMNKLDNRKSNLRVCDRHQNRFNMVGYKKSSKYKGVSWHIGINKWTAVIGCRNKKTHIGCFDDEKEAAKAYDREAIRLHGEFARTNF